MSYDFESQFKQESSAFYYVNPADVLSDQAANDQSQSLLGPPQSTQVGPLANLIKEDYIVKQEPSQKQAE